MADRSGFRLAVAQTSGALNGAAARLAELGIRAAEAARAGADLVLFPELFASGYYIGPYCDQAEPRDGHFAAEAARIAAANGIAVAYGYVERDGGTIYNSAIAIGATGETIGEHRKLAIPPGIEDGQFAAGVGCRLFTFQGVRVALLICYDVEFAECARHVAAQGAELILAPTALGAEWVWVREKMIPTRAFENGVFLAYANHAGAENGKA